MDMITVYTTIKETEKEREGIYTEEMLEISERPEVLSEIRQ